MLVRVERFELITKLVLNQPPLPIGLHAQNDLRLNWYRRRDSNPHCLVPKTSASSQLGYAGMVNPAGLEPATCRLGDDCSNSAELRVLRLVAETGLEPASTGYESVPGGFTTPVYSASNFELATEVGFEPT